MIVSRNVNLMSVM